MKPLLIFPDHSDKSDEEFAAWLDNMHREAERRKQAEKPVEEVWSPLLN